MAPPSNDRCDNNLYNYKWELRAIRRRKQLWVVVIDGKAGPNIRPHVEAYISYDESAFCNDSLPLAALFKAVCIDPVGVEP